MSDKGDLINSILDIVIKCCNIDGFTDNVVTKDDILSKNRNENVVMTRAMCVYILRYLIGCSITTLSSVFGRTEKAISNILESHVEYKDTSFIYLVAFKEAKTEVSSYKDRYFDSE